MVAIPFGNGLTLAAEAELVPQAPGVVVCHPHPAFGGRMDTPLVIALADGLSAAGLSTVRFNFRGLDGSGGVATGGARESEDVRAVADWLRRSGAPRVALVGYSFGALMAMKAVAAGEPAFACAAVGFPTTIIGEDADRVAEVERALDAGPPWLFVHGTADPFCEHARIRAWAAPRPHLRLDELPAAGHFFTGPAQSDVVARVVAFIGGHSLPP